MYFLTAQFVSQFRWPMNYLRQEALFPISSHYHITDAFPSLQITAHPNNTWWIIKICFYCMHKITGESVLDESCFNIKRCKLSNKNTFGCSPSSFNCFIHLKWAEKVYLSNYTKPQRRTTHTCMNPTYSSNPKTRNWLIKWLTAACHGGGSREGCRYLELF